MAILEVEHINKTFGRTEVLKDISFSLERGQVLSLIAVSYTHLTLPTNREV